MREEQIIDNHLKRASQQLEYGVVMSFVNRAK